MRVGRPVQITSLAAMPWKNGGGVTRTLAVEPEGAGFDTFLWRLSFAEVSASGGFSQFPGVDRTLLLWRGGGMRLEPKDDAAVTLLRALEGYEFRGEEEIEATLIDGPTVDFNVMVRRGRARAEVLRYEANAVISRGAQWAFFVCARGSFRLRFSSGEECLVGVDEALPVWGLMEGVRVVSDGVGAAMVLVLIDSMESMGTAAG